MWGQSPARSNNGTRSLQNAVGNGGPGHIPLDVAAEVARSVNAGTTGLMPKELAKRQLETAWQLMAERAKAKLEESAAEHGNTPEAERAVLDTPVEMPDGTIASLASLEEAGSQDARAPRPGNAPAESARPGNAPAESARPGNAPAESKPGGRPGGAPLQGAPASGLRPVGDGVYVHGAVPEARVETGAEIDMPDGTRVKGVLVRGLDPAEMLRPERRDAVADFLIEVIDGAQGRVAFETPEAEAAARELLKERMAKERAQAQRQAEQEIVDAGQNLVDGLFGKESGVKVRRGTPEEAMEAAEGAVGKNAAVELLKDTAGEVKGYWDRAKREVVLFGGASVETLGHEIAWHAVRQWAETHSPELLAKMNEYAKRCPEELRKLIEEAYKDFSGDALLDEIGAGRFENELGGRFRELLGRNAEARTWWEGVKATLKEMWQAFVKMIDGGGIDLSRLEKMDADEGMRWLVDQMLQGRRLEGGGEHIRVDHKWTDGQIRFSRAKVVTKVDGNESYKVESNGKTKRYKTPKEALEDFIKELDGQALDVEQQGIYDVVVGDKRTADIRKNDLGELIKLHKGGRGKGAQKILSVHYAGKRGKVTAKEVINMGLVIRNGKLTLDGSESHPNARRYEATAEDGARLRLIVDLDKKGNEAVINLYSDRKDGNPGHKASSGVETTSSSPQSIPQNGGGAQAQIRPSIAGRKGAERLGVGKAADAEAMEKAGASREEIWKATRLWKDKEGKWREGPLPSPLGDGNQKYYEVPFDKAVDKIVANGKSVGKEGVFVSSTPEVFERIGFARLPIMMTQNHVLTISSSAKTMAALGIKGHPHDMKDVLKQVPGAINKPLMIIASETKADVSVVAITQLKDKKDNSVIVPIAVNGKSNVGEGLVEIDAHIMTSAYGRGNTWSKLVLDALDAEAKGNVGVFYIDNAKASVIWNQLASALKSGASGAAGLQLPQATSQSPSTGSRPLVRRSFSADVVHRITDSDSPVNTSGMLKQTETRQFKEFFGDAKKDPANASKVVDANGEPLVVYHGTEKNFWAFSDQQIGSHTDAGHEGGVGLWGRGHYFTSDRSEAEGYVRGNPDGRTMAVYLNIRNPMGREELVRIGEEAARITEERPEDFYREYQRLIDESVRQNGYDGAIVKHRHSTEYVVFEPEQVKSATDNIGTFDPGNPDIRFSRGGYKPGDWRKTFTFGKAARGEAERTNGGLAAGEERRRWEENPVDERIPEWDAPQRNPNIAKPFALSAAEGVRLVKLLGGTMKKPRAYKDAIGVIDESDEQRIREDLKAMGFFKSDDYLWAATSDPATVAADRADSQAALDARLEGARGDRPRRPGHGPRRPRRRLRARHERPLPARPGLRPRRPPRRLGGCARPQPLQFRRDKRRRGRSRQRRIGQRA